MWKWVAKSSVGDREPNSSVESMRQKDSEQNKYIFLWVGSIAHFECLNAHAYPSPDLKLSYMPNHHAQEFAIV